MATGPAAGVATLLIIALAGCSATSGAAEGSPRVTSTTVAATGTATSSSADAVKAPADSVRSAPVKAPPVATPRRVRPRQASPASMSISSIGVRTLSVVAYTGHADDLPGTHIQDRGLAASPRGPRGGVGPGQIGNLIITAHRTSAGGPFRRLPSLRHGAHVLIASGDVIYDYVVTGTMTISFRSARDLARQSAPVPGHPGRRATRAMITLSTCTTPEDHARGNYWKDELGNPEHRIDKVGVLVAVRGT
jgi:sortase A